MLTAAIPPAPGVVRSSSVFAGRTVEVHRPVGADRTEGVVLYLHGGGLALGSPRGHRSLVGRLAAVTCLEVDAIAYRLAPEHPFPAAPDDVWAAYLELREQAGADAPVVLAGDPAGGALALGIALRARGRGVSGAGRARPDLPGGDLTAASNHRRGFSRREPLLTLERLEEFAVAHAGGADRPDPEPSPLLTPDTDWVGLPPVVLDTVEHDPLRLDGEAIRERLEQAGVRVDHRRLDGWFHDVHLAAGLLPVATAAVEGLGPRLRAHRARCSCSGGQRRTDDDREDAPGHHGRPGRRPTAAGPGPTLLPCVAS